jgi:hypothetical protein
MDAKDLYDAWITRLWHGELEVADEIIAEGFVGHWPEEVIRGRNALVDLIVKTRGVFSELDFVIELGPIMEGDLLAARWTGSGRSDDEVMRFLGNDLMRIQDGRICEYWVASWASG